MLPTARVALASLWCALLVLSAPIEASAGNNDIVLSRLATFDPNEFSTQANPCDAACGVAKPDTQAFKDLALDLGEVFAPRFLSPAETLGEAGYAINFVGSVSFIPNNEQYWQTAVEDNDPGGSLFVGQLQLRKGLPFSFELAGNLSYLSDSEMFAMGADVKWALNEGFKYLPALAIRGSVNTVMGAPELNLLTAGGDVSVSKAFGIGGAVSLTPYVGYQKLYIVASSRLINAYPQDPRPPQFDEANPSQQFSPEFVFSQSTQDVDRVFLGTRLNVWIMSFSLEGVIGNRVNQFTFAGGVDF